MSYESAPATKMLATHCAVCARPLVDAQSVEMGIGPDCRKKYGFNCEVDPETRKLANQIVYQIALVQTGAAAAEAAAQLIPLGFTNLAARILRRLVDVRIEEQGNDLLVTTPYTEASVEAIRHIPGRRWDKAAKLNRLPKTSRAALWAFLKQHFSGLTGSGPKGLFQI